MTDAPALNYIYAVGLYTYDNVQYPIIKRGIWISLSSTSINLLYNFVPVSNQEYGPGWLNKLGSWIT